MRCFNFLPFVACILHRGVFASTPPFKSETVPIGCLSIQDEKGKLMQSEADVETFAEALRNADEGSVRACLCRNPSLAVAMLPSDWPVFLEQAMFPRPAIIDLLIASGADPDTRSPDGETLLHLTGDPEAIRKLLSRGADINALDHRGYTPMMAHAPYPETGLDAIYTLYAQGADPDIVGLDGQTVFDLLPQGAQFDRLRHHMRGKDHNR